MEFSDFAAVPAIVVLVYLAAYLIKLIPGETVNRMLPALCGVLGLILGIVCYFTLPGFIPAENWLTAAAVGIVSGFAATGVNQIYKQASKGKAVEIKEDDEPQDGEGNA